MPWIKKQVLVRIDAQIVWEAIQDPRDGHWFGVCRPLNLNAVGNTWAEFQECANEAITLLLQDLLQTGELEAFLRRNHWHAAVPLPAPGTRARFDVPFTIERKPRLGEPVGALA
jgi:predicted RNase H-like HicB family nuclease